MTGERRPIEDLWSDDDVEVYRFDYDASDDLLVELVLAIAEVRDEDPGEVSPLASGVDTDRLDACIASLNDEDPTVEGKVTFGLDDCDVTVLPEQVVIAAPRNAPEGRSRAGSGSRAE